jgi:hypothetical protein
MTRRDLRWFAATAALAAAGCTVTSAPFWEGTDASMSLAWTINGRPAGAASCGAVGGSTVILSVARTDPGCRVGEAGCGESHETWVWPCAGGTATTGPILRSGTVVHAAWALVGDAGQVRQGTIWQPRTLLAGENGSTVDFTPPRIVGPDAAAVTTWTIEGEDVLEDACLAAGAETVRVTYRAVGTTIEETRSFACAAGTGSTGNRFASGDSYEFRWDVLDAHEAILARVPFGDTWERRTMDPGDNAFTVRFSFPVVPDARLDATWTLHGTAPDLARCTAVGASSVRLTWRWAVTGGTESAFREWPCAAGSGGSGSVLSSGTAYALAWDLLDGEGEAFESLDGGTVTAAAGPNAVSVDFEPGGTLTVNLEWADKVADPAYGDCAFPPDDVAEIGWLLRDAAAAVVDEADIETAPETCTTTLRWDRLPFDTYSLDVAGRAADPATAAWAVTCPDLLLDDITACVFTCRVEMTVP